tara:strand:+ start:16 stop:2085 length:2070 start_codon:yes stop_codon:yes gene_type:complete
MTINLADNDPRIEYTVADGNSQQVFTVPFEFFDDGDLNVYQDGTLKTLTTHYLTADNNDATSRVAHTSGTTGFIHFTTGNVPTASGADIKIVITRSIDIERTTDFPSSGPFDVGALNTALDKVIAIQADLQDDISRSLRLTDFDLDATLTLPAVDSRKGTVLAFNSTTGAAEAGPQTGNVNTIAAISTDINTVAGIAANVTTVAGNNSNVTTVAGISSNVTTVAGIASDVSAVAADATDIGAVAAKATEIGRLGTADAVADMAILGTADVVADMNTLATSAIVTDLDALANLATEIDALGDITSNITTVAGISSNVTTVAGVAANVTTVAGVASDVTTVAGISSDVAAVENIAANVTTVAGIASNVTTVANDGTDIGTVAGISSNVSTVAGISANVTTVAGVSSDVTTVAGISSNVTTVATNNANVTTVASNITGVNSFAERYRVGSSDPTTSLDEGDLAYNSTSNQLKYYNGSSWEAISPGITDVVGDTTPQLGGNLDVNGNSIVSVSNGNISITPNGSGKVILDGLSHPTADGSAGQFLKTDGGGNLSFATVTTDLSGDTTPQLGGNLDVVTHSIVSTSNRDITINPNGTGNVLIGNYEFDADQSVGAGQDNYVLTYDNSTGHVSLEAAAAAGATGGGSDEIFYENGQNVTTNYTITNGKNAMSAGPITINSGVTVTVGTGETWTVV